MRLTVSDLARSRAFYEHVLGLVATQRDQATLSLGTPNRKTLLELHEQRSAPPPDHRKAGLYHLAILVPSRRDLAFAVARLATIQWPLDGASDHLVSEALYVSDPDGNGIEIYRDRPRREWPTSNGRLAMATLPLDLDDLLVELIDRGEHARQLPAAATIGHVHLRVSDLDAAEAFYSGVLGFDVTVRGYPGALFLSAGGYHHHLGLNTWRSAGGGPSPPGSIGLRNFDVVLRDSGELEAVRRRLDSAGVEALDISGGVLVHDPSGNALVLRAP